MRLTESTIKTIGNPDRELVFWDEELKGFGLRVQPSGRRTFIVQYRTPGGRRGRLRKVTLGAYGSPWTAHSARTHAARVLLEARAGHDPAGQRAEQRKGLTVQELCAVYFAEGCADKRPSTLNIDIGRVRRHVVPLLGAMPASSVHREDIERFIRDVASGRTAADVKTGKRGRAIVRGGRGAATRTAGLLGAIFTFAERRGLVSTNPVRGVRRFPDQKGERHLTTAEWSRLGEALRAAQAAGANPSATGAIHLIALTGARKGEVLGLQWSDVDLDQGLLKLRQTKTGPRLLRLGEAALQLLRAHRAEASGDWVFPGAGAGPYGGLDRAWRSIRTAAGLCDVRMHDLRHSFATEGVGLGLNLPVLGSLLGHRQPATTSRYAHVADDPAKRAADLISQSIAQNLKEPPGL